MDTTPSTNNWNKRWPSCLVGLDELMPKLKAAQAGATPEDVSALEFEWSFLTASTVKMDDLLQGRQPPDSQPGDYEFGPVLPVIHYELSDRLPGWLMEVLRALGLPDSPITPSEWNKDLEILDSNGQVASDGSLVAHSDLAVADYCWVISVLKYLLLKLGIDKRHGFVPARAPIPVPGSLSSLTLAVAGDWGSGKWDDAGKDYPANMILAQMQAAQPDFMVHLGDVYYAGTSSRSDIDRDEEKRHFTDLWKPGSLGALTLNSNHEMYSGANGLYEALGDSMFAAQGGATYFAIEFEGWLVLGLDTAYYDQSTLFMDGALTDPNQLGFIKNLKPLEKRVLVLTHHNGLLYTGEKKQPLWDQVCHALGKQPEVWYWGHIHNGIAYSSSSEAGATLARCCGHGALPFGNAYGLSDASGQPIPSVAYYAHRPLPDPVVPPQKHRVLNGFATLCLERGKLIERFYEQGRRKHVWEKITAF